MSEYLYVVSWDADGIVKVGCTSKRRWRMFTNRGARLVYLEQFERFDDCYRLEYAIHRKLWATRPQAFTSRHEAIRYLGGSGGGWVECVRATPEYALSLLAECKRAMHRAYAPSMRASNAQANAPSMCTRHMHVRTYVLT